jgi:diguanylate cyclase (GGDEF)-like protein/PAS domain S-box-containing protein
MDRAGASAFDVSGDEEAPSLPELGALSWLRPEPNPSSSDEPHVDALHDLVRLAAGMLAAPIATVAIRGADRQCFQAALGLQLPDAAIQGSAFEAVVRSRDIVTLSDERGTALLPGLQGIRSCVGIRLTDRSGGVLGALCLYDRHIRRQPLSAAESELLRFSAKQISLWLEVRQTALDRARLDEAQRIAQQAANVGVYISEKDGRALCSPEFYQQLGLPLDTPLVGKRWLDSIHPADRAFVDQQLAEAIGGGDLFACDFRVIRADTGEIRWISSRSRIERDQEGNPLRAIGANIDITDRKRAQAEAEEGRNLLQSVIDQSSDAIFVKDLDHRFVLASEKCDGTIGRSAASLIGHNNRELFSPAIAYQLDRMDRLILDRGEPDVFEREAVLNGETRVLETSAVPWRRDGAICGLIAISRDITDQRRADRVVRESEERFRLAARAAGLGIWDFDASTRIRRWSDHLLHIFGLPAAAVPDRDLARELVHPDDRPIFDALMASAQRGGENDRLEATMRLIRPGSNEERWIATNGWRTVDGAGKMSRLIIAVRDITDEKTAQARIRWSAHHDPLTGLPNRLLFQEEIATALQGHDPGAAGFGLLLLDVDRFKHVNDTLGHDAGDALLRSVGERLRGGLRAGDFIARLGGDEFAVILRAVDNPDGLTRALERLLASLHEPVMHVERMFEYRVSIGATIYPGQGRTADDLLKNADTALYVAKSSGRGQMVLFRPEMRRAALQRSTMVQTAREALEGRRMKPFYQPQVELISGKLIGFEALLRWWKPGGRMQAPGGIAPAFDDLELAPAIGDYMMDRISADVRGWLEAGLQFGRVAINASAAEFRMPDFAERMLERLARAGVPAACIELEVTESVFLGRDGSEVGRVLAILCAAGIRIALDDFGTGYASLSHLQQFPVDTIKIDRSFLNGLEEEGDNAAIVRALISLGSSLGIKVVAEGIERPAQAEYLRRHGCDIGQGYLLGRPLPGARLPKLIREWQPGNLKTLTQPGG